MENYCGKFTAADSLRKIHCGKSLRPVYALRNKRPLRLLRIAVDRVAFDFHPYNNGSSGNSDATHTVARCKMLAPGSRSWRTV